jgi:tRNA/rRNA methyltransferase
LVEPAVPVGVEGRMMAVRSEHILDAAVRVGSLAAAVAPFRRVVGTTSGRERTTGQPVWSARQLARHFVHQRRVRPPTAETALTDTGEDPESTALVFGPETSGLTNDELALCGWLVTIPCAPARPTLNLSQAVLLVAYEFYVTGPDDPAPTLAAEPVAAPAPPAPSAQVAGLFEQAEALLAEVGFARDGTFEGVLRDLRALAARSGLTEREVAILRGVCRRVGYALRRTPSG